MKPNILLLLIKGGERIQRQMMRSRLFANLREITARQQSSFSRLCRQWNQSFLLFFSCFFFFSFSCCYGNLGVKLQACRSHRPDNKLRREKSSSKLRLRCRAPAPLQSTLEFLQEHTCTLRSVMFVMGGFPESVTMMGRL